MSTLEHEPTTPAEPELSEVEKLEAQLAAANRRAKELDDRSYKSYHRTFGREINEMLEELRAHRHVRRLGKALKKAREQGESSN